MFLIFFIVLVGSEKRINWTEGSDPKRGRIECVFPAGAREAELQLDHLEKGARW